MKSERLLQALGKIDDQWIVDAMELPEKAKPVRRRWVKYGLIAACLCLLLAVPIVASQTDLIVDVFSDMTGWNVRTKNYFANTDFSEELIEQVKELAEDETGWKRDAVNRTIYIPVDSEVEAEKKLGIAIPNNALLTEEIKDDIHMEVEENGAWVRYDRHCLLQVTFDREGNVRRADTMIAYRYEGSSVTVTYGMMTEDVTRVDGGGFGSVRVENMQEQRFVSTAGRECVVYYSENQQGKYFAYGYTVVDKVLLEISIIGESRGMLEERMVRFLNAYE